MLKVYIYYYKYKLYKKEILLKRGNKLINILVRIAALAYYIKVKATYKSLGRAT